MNAAIGTTSHFRRAALVAQLLLVAMSASPANAQAPTAVTSAQRLIATARYDDAVALVEAAEREAGAPTFELEFMKGVAWQESAGRAGLSPEQRNAELQRARAAYERAWGLRPGSVATLNNLAALDAAAGRDREARQYYERALATARENTDPRLETYALNYARFLLDRGDGRAAAQQAEIAMKAGSSSESRELLASLYERDAPAALLPLYRTLLDEGRTTEVTDTAIRKVLDTRLGADDRREWLNLTALAMARDVRARASYELGPTLQALRQAPAGDPLSPGAMQLEIAALKPPGTAQGLGWWAGSRSAGASGVSSRFALRQLLTALGEHNASQPKGGTDIAARYLATAVELGDRGPDPESFLSLVTLYADAGDVRRIQPLVNRYEDELFSEKSDAYIRADWPLIYRMHTALGMAYAHLQVWENRSAPIQSALFQLEHAQTAAAELNRRASAEGKPASYALPAAAVTKLSEAYLAVGRGTDAARLRVDSAATLRNLGRINESAQLVESLEPADVSTLSTDKRQMYERMRAVGRAPN
jgi:hypothetical protein